MTHVDCLVVNNTYCFHRKWDMAISKISEVDEESSGPGWTSEIVILKKGKKIKKTKPKNS